MQLCDFKVVPVNQSSPMEYVHHKDRTVEKRNIGKKVIQTEIGNFKLHGGAVKVKNSFLKESWMVVPSKKELVFYDCKKGSLERYPLYEQLSIEVVVHSFPWIMVVDSGHLVVIRVLREESALIVRRYYWNKAPIVAITMSVGSFTVITTEGLHFFRIDVNEVSEYFKILEMGYIEISSSAKIRNIFKQFQELFLRGSQNVVDIFNLKTQSLVYSIQTTDNSFFIHGHIEDNVALCSTSNSLYMIFLESRSVKSVFIIPLSSPISVFNVCQDFLLTGSFDGAVRVYDLKMDGTHLYDLNVGVACNALTTTNMVNSLTRVGDEYVIISTNSGLCEVYSLNFKYQRSPIASFDLHGSVVIEISTDQEQVNFLTHNKENNTYGYFVWKPSIEKLQSYTNETILSEFIFRPKPEKKGVFHEWKFYTQSEISDPFMHMVQKLAEKEYPFLMNWHHACTITNNTLPDNPIVFVTDSFCEMTGYTREEIYGQNCRFLQGKYSDSETKKKIAHCLRAGMSTSVQLLNYRKDGTPFWNVFVVLPVHDAKGKVPAFIAIQQDITEIRISQPLSRWLSVHTCLWLEHIGFTIYSHIFIYNKIDGQKLASLTIDQLISIGTSREDAHSIYEQIQILVQRDQKVKPIKHLPTSAVLKSRQKSFKISKTSRSAED